MTCEHLEPPLDTAKLMVHFQGIPQMVKGPTTYKTCHQFKNIHSLYHYDHNVTLSSTETWIYLHVYLLDVITWEIWDNVTQLKKYI